MQTIKVFIASSAELRRERMELVDLIQDLNIETKKLGFMFKPVLWEYMDSSMRIERKEDEYLEKLRECEICIVLFWNTLGEYTKEELNVAMNEKLSGRMPEEIHVLYKTPAVEQTEEMQKFKEDYDRNYSPIPFDCFESTKELRNLVSEILGKHFA